MTFDATAPRCEAACPEVFHLATAAHARPTGAPELATLLGPSRARGELRLLERWVPTVFAGRRVLEVAAGTGTWTRFIAPQTFSLLATDLKEQALQSARRRVASAKVRFSAADAYALPPALGQFDGAFAGFWLSKVPRSRLHSFFCSLHARLQPGAKVLLLDRRFVPGQAAPLVECDDEGNTYQVRLGPQGVVQRVLRNFPEPTELLQAVAGQACNASVHQWVHYWALSYELANPV